MKNSLIAQFLKQPFFAPDDAGGGAAPATPPADPPATPPAGSGDTPPADPPATPPATPPAGSGETPSAAQKNWWESDTFTEAQRTSLTAAGLTVDDPMEAIKRLTDMEIAAQRRLGANPDQLIQKPKEGQSVSEWMKENASVFGLPDAPDGYEIARPEGFGDGPDDLKWDGDFETAARDWAHRNGVPPHALQEITDLYGGKVKSLSDDADAQYAAANEKMMGELARDWGDQTSAKISLAKSGAEAVAQQAGIGSEQLAGISALLSKETGDAGTIRMFAAIGEMMSEDGVGKIPSNGGSLNTTPAEARAELAKQQSPGGEYYEAVAKGDKANIDRLKPRIEQLTKVVAQSSKK
jgi:hypothetical protein